MILRNDTPKGQFYTVVIEGVPQKVWVEAYGQYNLTNTSRQFDTGVVEAHGRKIATSTMRYQNNYVLVKGNNYSLINNDTNSAKNYDNFVTGDVLYIPKDKKVCFDIVDTSYHTGLLHIGTLGIVLDSKYGDISAPLRLANPKTVYVDGVVKKVYNGGTTNFNGTVTTFSVTSSITWNFTGGKLCIDSLPTPVPKPEGSYRVVDARYHPEVIGIGIGSGTPANIDITIEGNVPVDSGKTTYTVFGEYEGQAIYTYNSGSTTTYSTIDDTTTINIPEKSVMLPTPPRDALWLTIS